MTTILHIDSSARTDASISRQLTEEFLGTWKTALPVDQIITRQLATHPIPHLTESVLGAFFTPEEQRSAEQGQAVRLSDELIHELFAADVIVIGAPMYNFSVSSALKAWIDHVARAGLTFNYTAEGPIGLVKGKKVFVLSTRGGVYTEGPGMSMDFHEPYLRAVLGFLGLTDISFIHTEGLALGEQAAANAISQTRDAIGQTIWSVSRRTPK